MAAARLRLGRSLPLTGSESPPDELQNLRFSRFVWNRARFARPVQYWFALPVEERLPDVILLLPLPIVSRMPQYRKSASMHSACLWGLCVAQQTKIESRIGHPISL